MTSGQTTDRVDWTAHDESSTGPLCLLVVTDGATALHRMPATGPVTIGRAPTADVRVDDKSVSREHARLHLDARVTLEDLGSANGTRVRDAPVEPGSAVEVFPDDVIDLGAVILVLQYGSLEQRLRRFCHPAALELRVEEECERVATGGGEFALASLQVESGLNPQALQRLLASELPRSALIAARPPASFEVLLFDTGPEAAADRVARAGARLNDRGVRLRSTIRSCPRDGRDPAALLNGAGPARRPAPLPAGVVVRDPAMLRVYRLLERVAESALNLLLLGETGAGKELCAEFVHRASSRRNAPFLRLNCTALSETLVESELFGHERGAFTGAIADKPGLLEAASGGTLLLDEVGDMPLSMQAKLLRVFEAKEVLRIGARTARPIDVRVISATHHDLEQRVSDGRFREDLLYRLNGIAVVVPPLRQRRDDLEPLARHFLTRAGSPAGHALELSPGAIARLAQHAFPGNVRELRNVIERAAALCDGPAIEPRHLSFDAGVPPNARRSGDLKSELRALERERIESALAACGGNQRRAAPREIPSRASSSCACSAAAAWVKCSRRSTSGTACASR